MDRLGRSGNAKTTRESKIFPTDRPTDLPTDTASSRVAGPRLKMMSMKMTTMITYWVFPLPSPSPNQMPPWDTPCYLKTQRIHFRPALETPLLEPRHILHSDRRSFHCLHYGVTHVSAAATPTGSGAILVSSELETLPRHVN